MTEKWQLHNDMQTIHGHGHGHGMNDEIRASSESATNSSHFHFTWLHNDWNDHHNVINDDGWELRIVKRAAIQTTIQRKLIHTMKNQNDNEKEDIFFSFLFPFLFFSYFHLNAFEMNVCRRWIITKAYPVLSFWIHKMRLVCDFNIKCSSHVGHFLCISLDVNYRIAIKWKYLFMKIFAIDVSIEFLFSINFIFEL